MFSSDSNFVSYNLPLDNVIISDHMLCVIGTNTNISSNRPIDNGNIYSTNICDYNLMDATSEEWCNLNEYYSSINWDSVLSGDINSDCDNLISLIEIGVKRYMRKMAHEKTNTKSNGEPFKSSNLIPKDVRTLFKRKSKLSKAYRKVKTINRCSSIRKRYWKLTSNSKTTTRTSYLKTK